MVISEIVGKPKKSQNSNEVKNGSTNSRVRIANRSPPTMYFQKMSFLGVFRPFLQRSLLRPGRKPIIFVANRYIILLSN